VAKTRITKLTIVLASLVLGLAAAWTATGTASAAGQKYCPPTPKTAPANQIPVWVLLEVRTRSSVLEKDVAFTVRRYKRTSSNYVVPGWAYSGCWSVLLYKPSNLPTHLCITVRAGFTAPDGPCQAVRSGPTGQKEVRFRLTSA
jgi:hypothetical protein